MRTIPCLRHLLLASLASIALGCAAPPAAGDRVAASPAASSANAAPAGVRSLLVNPGFESDKPGEWSDVDGWHMYQHAGEKSYDFVVDPAVAHGGARSMRIVNVGTQPYGSLAQDVPGAPFSGKTVRFSGWMKTRDTNDGGAALFIIADRGGAITAHEFMEGAEVKGTRDWQRYTITLAIPPSTSKVRVGVTLQGTGTVWVDDAELEIVNAR
jgi:hypothetical protein